MIEQPPQPQPSEVPKIPSEPEKISLEEASQDFRVGLPIDRGNVTVTESQIRLGRFQGATALSFSLWILLGAVIFFHLAQVSYLVRGLVETTKTAALADAASPSPTPATPNPTPTASPTRPAEPIAAPPTNLTQALNRDQRIEVFQTAIAAVNDTAKSLYTFLTPLIAGVTAFFFTSKDN